MKKRKNWKKVAVALLIGSQLAGTLPWSGMTVFAEEIETENMGESRLADNLSTENQVLKITGEAKYDEAYKVLEILNQERAKEGLGALTMDEELLETAMLRAAECSLYYEKHHTRPDGTECFTAAPDRMKAENISFGYEDAKSVMEGWMNSPGHRENILNTSRRSVGIGCFYIDDHYTWAQCFGDVEGIPGETKSNKEASYSVTAAKSIVIPSLAESSGTLEVGETKQLQISAVQGIEGMTSDGQIEIREFATHIDADSYNWESDSAAATVSSDGVITAVRPGKAVITGSNKANASQVLTYTLTVSGTTAILFGDVNGDGKFDLKDGIAIKRYASGYIEENIDKIASDVNVDGKVNLKDAIKIVQKLAGHDVVLGTE